MSRSKIYKKTDLTNLTKYKEGRYKRSIDWNSNKGKYIHFIYGDIEGDIEIISYNKNTEMIKVFYKDKEHFIHREDIRKANIGRVIGIITKEFKIEIGTTFKDDKRDITILDKELRPNHNNDGKFLKYYKYHCNKDSYEGWIEESHLLGNKKGGCLCCSGKLLIEGYNDIPTTAPFMVKYFPNGYDEAKLYTKWGFGNPSNPKGHIHPICPKCGRIKSNQISIGSICTNEGIGCSCSDNISYPEKIMYALLNQLKINYISQATDNTFTWSNKKQYDFYLTTMEILIETHGIQHYKEVGFTACGGRTLIEEQENDKLKKELALSNGIKEENYIVIDCRKSELDFIKQNILKSNLAKLFDLSKIDWIKCHEFALSNLVKTACDYKKNDSNLTSTEIGEIMNLGFCTIIKYLKIGNELGWCYYNAKEEQIKATTKGGKKNGMSIKCKETGHTFYSASECARCAFDIFGIKMTQSGISLAINENRKYKNFTFRYC